MKNFGKEIKKIEGDQMFQTFKGLKLRTVTGIKAALSSDAEALRYFTGTDLAFVFDKVTLQNLSGRLTNDTDCIILFNGSRYDDEFGKLGRPTLCAFAYKVQYNEVGHRIATIQLSPSVGNDDGYEHPGNFSIDINSTGIPLQIDLDKDVNMI